MQGDGYPFEHYVECLALPSYLNFGLYAGDVLTAAITLERVSDTVARFHVAKAARTIGVRRLAQTLTDIKDYLFASGFDIAEAAIPPANRAAAFLALRCGMRETGTEDGKRIFRINREANGS